MKECGVCRSCYDEGVEVCQEDSSSLVQSLEGGRLIDGKYLLERTLGQGGMGVVFRARHVGLGRAFALKLIRPSEDADPSFLARFRSEATALGRLKHPNIVDVTDFGVDSRGGGTPYLVMELLEGLSLAEHCKRRGPLPLDEALPILSAIANATDFAHSQGILHRDLKTLNVFLCRSGGRFDVKLLDFGLAKLKDEAMRPAALGQPVSPGARAPGSAYDEITGDIQTLDLRQLGIGESDAPETAPGEISGTPPYMAPERFTRGESSSATDIYALGVLAYRLLTGQLPFDGSLTQVVKGHLYAAPPAPSSVRPSLPAALDAPLVATLAKEAGARPATARSFVATLREVLHRQQLADWRRRELPRRCAIAAALALVVPLVGPVARRVGPIADLERRTIDWRFGGSTPRAPDPRLLLVVLDDASLAGKGASLSAMADEVAETLERVYAAGARAVAVDLLLPRAWGRSGAFAGLAARHRERLTLAAHAAPGGMVGVEAAEGLISATLGPERALDLFGLVNLEEDSDGLVRRARFDYTTERGSTVAAWAAQAARTLEGRQLAAPPNRPTSPFASPPGSGFWLDLRVDAGRFPLITWDELRAKLDSDPGLLRDRLVLLGSDLAGSGDDAHRIPGGAGTSRSVPGIVVNALAIDTILSGFPFRDLDGPFVAWIWAGATLLAAASALCSARLNPALIVVAGLLGVLLSLAYLLFHSRLEILPIVTPALLLITMAGIAVLVRARLAPHPGAKS